MMVEGAVPDSRRSSGQAPSAGARPEGIQPRFVVTMVHGTFARRATWVDAESAFGRELHSRLESALIQPWRWSGGNDVRARQVASGELRVHLRGLMDDHPDAYHCVVAHSHGGNVVLNTLSDPELAGRICGVVTLATPFLSAREAETDFMLGPGDGVMAAVFTGFGVFALGAALGHGRGWWWLGLLVIAGVIGVLALAAVLAGLMHRHAGKVCAAMPATRLPPARLSVIRTATDEAAGTLAGARVAGVLVGLVWTLASSPASRPLRRLLGLIDYGGVRHLEAELSDRDPRSGTAGQDPVPYAPSPPGVAPPGASALRRPRSAVEAARAAGLLGITVQPQMLQMPVDTPAWRDATRSATATMLGVLPVAVLALADDTRPLVRWLGVIVAAGYGLPAILALVLGVVSLPFGVFVAAGTLPCGWTLPLAGPFLDISVEPTPPGTWSVTQLPSGPPGTGLSHTRAHDDPEVHAATAQFLLACAARTQ